MTCGEDIESALARRFHEIQVLAYYHWLNRGLPYGSPLEDWISAEQEWAQKEFLANPKTHNG